MQNLQMFRSRSGVHSVKAGIKSESKILDSVQHWQVHLRNFSCVVTTSCMSVAVSNSVLSGFLEGMCYATF